MDIGNRHTLGEDSKAADLDVLADNEDHLLLLLLNSQVGAVVLAGHEGLQISRLVGGHSSSNALHEVHKLLVLANEVGLGIDLDHNAHAINHSGIGHALGSYAAGLLGRSSQTFFAQELNGLVHIAIGSGQSLFAVHHTYAGHFAQILNISSGKSHNLFPPIYDSIGAYAPAKS